MNFWVCQDVYNKRNFTVRISAATFWPKRIRVLQVGIRALVWVNQVREDKYLNSNLCALVIRNPYNPWLDQDLKVEMEWKHVCMHSYEETNGFVRAR